MVYVAYYVHAYPSNCFFVDFDQRRVIPILYESCDIPEILKPIYYLNYEDSNERPYFWKKLAVALGYSAPEKIRESPRGSPRMSKKANESPLVDKMLGGKASPSAEKKSKGCRFKILKSKK
jgi:hypothetical protein